MKRFLFGLSLIFLTFILGIVSFLAFLNVFNEQIYKGKFCVSLRPLVELLCPPKDLFEPILFESLNISSSQDFEFRVKYPGKYSVSIQVENFKEFSEEDVDRIISNLVFLRGNVVLMEKVKLETFPFFNRNGGGISVARFDTQNIPIGTVITCRVGVNIENMEVKFKNKTINFVISKMSEL